MASNDPLPAPVAHDDLSRGSVRARRHSQAFHFSRSRAVSMKLRLSESTLWSYFPDTHAAAVFLTEKSLFSSVHTAEASLGKTLRTGAKRDDGLVIEKCNLQEVIDHEACDYVEYREIQDPHRIASWASAYSDEHLDLCSHYASAQTFGKAVLKKLNGCNVPGLSHLSVRHIAPVNQTENQSWNRCSITFDAPYKIRADDHSLPLLNKPDKTPMPCAHRCRNKATCLHPCCKIIDTTPATADPTLTDDVPFTQPMTTFNPSTPVMNPERRPCRHTCRDKQACGHICCKVGVLVEQSTSTHTHHEAPSRAGVPHNHFPPPLVNTRNHPATPSAGIESPGSGDSRAPPSPIPTNPEHVNLRNSTSNIQYRPCLHQCSDKTMCKHQCCKTGVRVSPEEATNSRWSLRGLLPWPNQSSSAPITTRASSTERNITAETLRDDGNRQRQIQQMEHPTSNTGRETGLPESIPQSTSSGVLQGERRRPCAHKCNDKTQCKHDCCKKGVLLKAGEMVCSALLWTARGLAGIPDNPPIARDAPVTVNCSNRINRVHEKDKSHSGESR